MADKSKAGQPDPPQTEKVWLGVYVLTQFIFCPRAAILAFEKGVFLDEDTPFPTATWMPWEEKEIDDLLRQQLFEAKVLSAIILGGGLLFFLLAYFYFPLLFIAGLVHVAWFGTFLVVRINSVVELQAKRRALQTAAAAEPDPKNPGVQPVSWWALLKAGFESRPLQSALKDPQEQLQGEPWRVLRKGSMRIPVWRLPTDDRTLYPKHFARMAAYAHLLRASEGGETPFGVILYANSHEGVAIPLGKEANKIFETGLATARTVIAEKDKKAPPVPPANVCRGCMYGHPRQHKLGATENVLDGKTLSVCGALDGEGMIYHSLCGDRFSWLPPHEEKENKQLKA
jgi:CRISPR/Cas system-associated exonuclease Cas4 (RecB family)